MFRGSVSGDAGGQAMGSTAPLAPVKEVRARPARVGRLHIRVRPRTGAGAALASASLDLAMVALAVAAAAVGSEAAGVTRALPAWTAAYGLVALVLLWILNSRAGALGPRTLDDLRRVVGATTLAAVSLLAVAALVDAGQPAVDEVVRLWAFATVYVGAGRVALNRSQLKARRVGEGLRPTLIVGAGRVGRLTARRLLDAPELGLKPIGFLDKNPLLSAADEADLPVLGASWDLERVVRKHGVEQVIVSFSTAPDEVLLRLVRRCEALGLPVAVLPRLYEATTARMTVHHIGGLPLVSVHAADPTGWHFAVKYALDRVIAAVGLVVTAPILAAAAVAVWISLGRPILFRQQRIGRDGKYFEILKFRSMRDPEDPIGFVPGNGLGPGGIEGEDRRTRVGTFLRRTSIDELPQLWNVLRGDMSLVGPRPERPEFVDEFTRRIHRYGDRHRVKSGITGWSQVHGLRGQTSIADRAEWDNYYIENFSLWLDLRILVMTAVAVVTLFRQVE